MLQRRALQRRDATGGAPSDPALLHAAAEKGTSGVATPMPYKDAIQRSFGHHDIGHVQAHSDENAAHGAAAMGATAFAVGDHVAFAGPPSLHTAAHEAAHVVQQRAGVHLSGGVGQQGDAHERHADEVADRVSRGESSEELLDQYEGPTDGSSASTDQPVQRLLQNDSTQTLYVPPDWADTAVTYNNAGAELKGTLRTLLNGPHANTVRDQLNQALRIDTQHVEVTSQLPDEEIYYAREAHKRRQAQGILKRALREPRQLVHLESGSVENPNQIPPPRTTLAPHDLLSEPDDLGATHDIHKVCSFIALIAAEGAGTVQGALINKGQQVSNQSRDVLLTALHAYYYNTKHLMYDDTSTHPALFADWGYNVLFSGDVPWSALLSRRDLLVPGKRYIFDMVGHTCCAWLKKPLPAQPTGQETVKEFFENHHDPANYMPDEMHLNVHYIYGK
jgi:hypothetical protein